ncbi:MAG: ribonuclease P protein component [Flavobacteriales bacterium]
MKPIFTLSKKERLNSRTAIKSLLSDGEVVKAYPIFISYSAVKSEQPGVELMFSIGKKKQKLATRRNRIKRRLKEAYRLNKLSLLEFSKTSGLHFQLMCIQVTGDDVPFATIERKMVKALSKIVEKEAKKLEE